MARRLWVPPPPEASTGSRQGPRELGRESEAQRNRSGCRRAGLLPALSVALCLASACLLFVVAPVLFAPGKGGRINILLLGVDRRAGNSWAYRTDTIMVVTIDPRRAAAGMLSIPRDLQIGIPGHGEDRINTANVFGYQEDDPGSGPALVEATIEGGFGVPIDGYLMVDFRAFERIIDTLGGIDVQVPEPLHDTQYPDPKPGDPHAFKTIHFDPGWQHMDGKRALQYARSRMSTSDFDRAKRQQLILVAIREKATNRSELLRWPLLAKTVADAVQTDMALQELLALAMLAARLDTSTLKQVVLEHPLVHSYRRADGASVQLPDWNLINPVLEDLFGSPASR